MWKALIKLVEKWAYRCDHKWEIMKTDVLDREMFLKGKKIINKIETTAFCEKCMETKKID